jgi:hypothetical protein
MKSFVPATLALGLSLTNATAQSLLTNGDFEADPFDTGWTQAGAGVFGGLAASSGQAAGLGPLSRIGQDLSGPGPDWQLDFYFALRNTTDRAFSLFVNTAGDAANTGAATINLRYQSGQFNTFGGGTFGSDLGLGTVTFSSDANGDGDFDDPGDVKNIYRMRLSGNGWGTGTSTYDIQLSNANETTFSRSVTGLNRYQNGSGNFAVPQAFVFNSAFGANPGFWVDDVTFANVEIPDDPNLTLNTPLPIFGTLPVDATAPTGRVITIQNTGMASDLTLTAGNLSGPDAGKFSLAESFPITIPPGGSVPLNVTFTPGAAKGFFQATLNLASNDSSSPSIPVALPVQLYLSGDQILTNGGFDADPATTAWITSGTVTPVPALSGPSGAAVHLAGPGSGGPATNLGQAVAGAPDWQLTFDLAIPEPAGRSFQLLVHNFGEPTRTLDAAVNLRYENGVFSLLSEAAWIGLPQLGMLTPSIDANADGDFEDPGDEKNVHRLRLTGRQWGTPQADYQIETTAANSMAFSASADRLTFRPAGLGNAVNSPVASLIFLSSLENSAGYTVDNVSLTAGAPPRLPVYENLGITQVAGGVILTWTPDFISTYKVWASPDLSGWSVLDAGLFGPDYQDNFVPGRTKRFYRVERE